MAQLLHVAVLRVEAPRRVRRRSEGARVLHRLHAPVGEVLVVLELVGVVLEDPELRGRLLLHVLGRAVRRLVGPRVVCPRPRSKWSLHCPPLRATLVARSFFSVWMPRSTTAMALRSSGRVRCVAQVCRDNKVPVVPSQLPRGALGGPAHRLGVLVLQRFHGGLQAVLRLPSRVLAEVDEVGLRSSRSVTETDSPSKALSLICFRLAAPRSPGAPCSRRFARPCRGRCR